MKRIATIALFALLLAVPSFAQGQPQPPKPPTAAAQDGFVPVDTPTGVQETIPAANLVGIAYGFIWVVLFGYVWSVKSRLARVEREMEAVSRRVPARK